MSRIAQRFDRAASTYAGATPIQRQVAARLAERIAQAGLPAGPRVVEFGCGAGYLPLAVWPRLPPSLWIATDIAPGMVAATARVLPATGLTAVMDAARPALAPGFDLVCSSLTLQWLDEPAAVIAGWRALARPGGVLALATLVDGTFAEWRAALAQAGAQSRGPAFHRLETARTWFGAAAQVETMTLTERHASGLAFLKAARRAGIDAGSGPAQNAGVMRRALRAFEARGAAVSYQVAIIIEKL